MDYSNLPGNSNRSKSELPEKREQIASGTLMKPSEGKKFAQNVIKGTLVEVKDHTLYDVLIPGIKKLILDGLSILFFGEVKKVGGTTTSSSKTSYTAFWSSPMSAAPVPKVQSPTIRFEYYDIAFAEKDQALQVREELSNIFDRFNYVCVSDLYEICGIEAPFTANNYGWYDIRGAKVVPTQDPDKPWALKMPPVQQINKR